MALTKAQLIDLNANELIIDLDADTSITADTDDQIDIKIAGADDFRFTANTFTALSGSSIVVPASGLTIGSTAVTSTAAELNLIDGGASTGTTAVADADGIITNDGGTMRLTTAATFKTYFQEGISTAYDDLTAGDAAVNITTSSGNITIDAAANDSDIIFKGTDNSADITMLTLDGSAAGDATFNNQIIVGDGKLVLNSTAVTSTAAELNILDGVTSTATELNLLDGKDATHLAVPGKIEGTNFTDSLLIGHATTGTLDDAQDNTGVGIGALDALTSGDNNTALGSDAGTSLTASSGNTLIGAQAGDAITGASDNTAIGAGALSGTMTDSNSGYNVAVGAQSLNVLNGGAFNVAVGRDSGRAVSSGDYNILIGYDGGDNITTGSGNVIIGTVDAAAVDSNRTLKIAGYDGSTTTTWISGDSSGNLTFAGTVGSGAITSTGAIQGTNITATTAFVPDAANGASLGTTALEFADLYLHDGAQILFGADQDVVLTHAADAGLTLKTATTSDDTKATLTLQTGETDIAANDVLGQLHFQAPDEGAGTDAILVAAGIAAISEGDFSASNNATKLSFQTGASEAASEKMSLSSAGILTVADDIIIGDGKTIGSASDPDAIAIAANGVTTFSQTPVLSGASISAGTIPATSLDIDGATDIGADIADADLFIVDDGAGGTNRKTTASRLKTYVGGGLVLLSSVTISGSGVYSINNVFSSTYRDYKIIGSGLDQATNNSKWLFFLSTSSGNDTDNHYWHGTGGYGDSTNAYDVGGEDVTDFSIIDATSNDNNGSTNFELTLYRPQLAAYTAYTCIAGGRRQDGTGHVQSSGGYQNSTNQHVGIGFNVNQGNMSSGTIKIFGIKDSN